MALELFKDCSKERQLEAIEYCRYNNNILNEFVIDKIERPLIEEAIKRLKEAVKKLNSDTVSITLLDKMFDVFQEGDLLLFDRISPLFDINLKVKCKFPEQTTDGTVNIKLNSKFEDIKYNISRDDLVSFLVNEMNTCTLDTKRGKMDYVGVQDYDSFFTDDGSVAIKKQIKEAVLSVKEVFETFIKGLQKATSDSFTSKKILEELENRNFTILGKDVYLETFDWGKNRFEIILRG